MASGEGVISEQTRPVKNVSLVAVFVDFYFAQLPLNFDLGGGSEDEKDENENKDASDPVDETDKKDETDAANSSDDADENDEDLYAVNVPSGQTPGNDIVEENVNKNENENVSEVNDDKKDEQQEDYGGVLVEQQKEKEKEKEEAKKEVVKKEEAQGPRSYKGMRRIWAKSVNSGKWRECAIIAEKRNKIRVHYLTFHEKYDEWLLTSSDRVSQNKPASNADSDINEGDLVSVFSRKQQEWIIGEINNLSQRTNRIQVNYIGVEKQEWLQMNDPRLSLSLKEPGMLQWQKYLQIIFTFSLVDIL